MTNTLGTHKLSRWTGHSPDGNHHNQTDYILIRTRFLSGVKPDKTGSFLSMDTGSGMICSWWLFELGIRSPTMQTKIWPEEKDLPYVVDTLQATTDERFKKASEATQTRFSFDLANRKKNLAVIAIFQAKTDERSNHLSHSGLNSQHSTWNISRCRWSTCMQMW